MSMKINVKSEFFYSFMVFCLIFFSDSTLMFGTNNKLAYIMIGKGCVFIITFLLFCDYCKNNNGDRDIIVPIILISCLLIDVILLNDVRGGYAVKIMLLLSAYYIIKKVGFASFITYFINIIFWLSIISIITFVLNCLFIGCFKYLPEVYNTSNVRFYSGGLFNIIGFDSLHYMRNYSIFREPGVFGVYVTIAVLYELILKKKISILKIIIFVIALLSTLSVTIFLSTIVIFVIYLIIGAKKINKKIYFTSLFFVFVMMFFLIVLNKMNIFSSINLHEKIISMNTRITSTIVNIKIWLTSPVFGVGVGNYLQKYLSSVGQLKTDGCITSTIFINFAMHGFLYGVLMMIAIFAIFKNSSKNYIINYLACLILLFLFICQYLIYDFMYNMLSMYGLIKLFNIIKHRRKRGFEYENIVVV